MIPIAALAFVVIVAPLLNYNNSAMSIADVQVSLNRLENKVFWPIVGVAALLFYVRNRNRIAGKPLPFHLLSLMAVLLFSLCSLAWAYKQDVTTVRLVSQFTICAAFVLPILVASDETHVLRAAFYCLACAAFVNCYFLTQNSSLAVATYLGYPGIYEGKNHHGMVMAIGFILAIGIFVNSPSDRALAIVAILATAVCLRFSNSKTAFALAFLAPALAAAFVMTSRAARLSPAVIIGGIAAAAYAFMTITGFSAGRISDAIYKDSTFSGRIFIWEYLRSEIDKRWLLGWGFNSFWQVGSDGLSILNAPGWIKTMPSGHSGYLDVIVELGHVGLALLVVFIFATLHAIGPMCRRDPSRAWILMSLAVFVIIYNFLESAWLHGFEPMWVIFLLIAAEAARANYAAAGIRDEMFPLKNRNRPQGTRPARITRRDSPESTTIAEPAFDRRRVSSRGE